ncbi:hypothetical protein TPHA_0J02480 [Tetrapisispora phaffii CBS 4417]|uniref:Ubiquinol-cytochrome c chaperone domain-containing protein n=1 Tax=Tetrapisispora phaffii (strain ATCC 24235 / CBS 4417 / NBRC 1672 / NRRL Y-8282 / UCD 70-5) TaxID=1071381 RepID=G8BYX6_TETPH|nr:hypothetical protein TPHA_0J02480 [Tetrapisispora phaffii CBS 4417]CCE65068.1 hypothetical protein TPHA_0J02480 [Tetrapisispora phaffii CBS 4417]
MLHRNILRSCYRVNYTPLSTINQRSLFHSYAHLSAKENIEEKSPEDLVKHSHYKSNPFDATSNKPLQKKPKNDLLSLSQYESGSYQLPQWKNALGELVIKYFKLDMDRVRAGSIAGSYYYSLCRSPGLQYENEPLSEAAKFFYEDLKLPRTFSQWFQITILHEWILFTRMRAMPFKYGRNYQQKLVDRTFSDIEMRLFEEMNVTSSRISDQYLKDFNTQLRGAVFAYDEGLYTDDATLATAIWRNLFGGRKDIDMIYLEAVVRYVRSNIYVLSKISDREFATGNFKFVPPNETVEVLTPEHELELKQKVIEKYEAIDNKPDILPSERSNLSYKN